jgi:hypothetical protein
MGDRLTITEIANVVIGLTAAQYPAAHRALRKAAQLGALGPAARLDAKGTQVFGPEALFRAALVVALMAAEIHGQDAARAIESADIGGGWRRDRLSIADAIEAAIRGEAVQFRRVVPGRSLPGESPGARESWWGHMIVRAGEPLPPSAESVLVVNLNRI